MVKNKGSQPPKNCYIFSKENKPDGKYLVYEIWEDKHPDKVVAGQILEDGDKRIFSQKQLAEKIIPLWRQTAADKNLKNPIVTVQGDIGKGSELVYGYRDDRKVMPPNSQSYTIKPIFDKNITLVRHAGEQGNSLVYHSPLDSSTLCEELTNFKKLLTRFFNGKYYKLLEEYSDKSSGWEWRTELIIDNARLRSTK